MCFICSIVWNLIYFFRDFLLTLFLVYLLTLVFVKFLLNVFHFLVYLFFHFNFFQFFFFINCDCFILFLHCFPVLGDPASPSIQWYGRSVAKVWNRHIWHHTQELAVQSAAKAAGHYSRWGLGIFCALLAQIHIFLLHFVVLDCSESRSEIGDGHATWSGVSCGGE